MVVAICRKVPTTKAIRYSKILGSTMLPRKLLLAAPVITKQTASQRHAFHETVKGQTDQDLERDYPGFMQMQMTMLNTPGISFKKNLEEKSAEKKDTGKYIEFTIQVRDEVKKDDGKQVSAGESQQIIQVFFF